jgi:hypothetical protein
MSSRRLHRRTLLRGAGGLAVGLPFLEAMEARGQTATAPQRLVLFYTPEGLIPSDWMPTGTETSWSFGPLMNKTIFNALKSKINVVKGLDMSAVMKGTLGDHPKSIIGTLTGTRANGNNPGGPSIDQFIASRLASGPSPARKRSMELGVQCGSGDGSLLMFDSTGRPVPPQQNPQTALNDLIKLNGGTGGTGVVNTSKAKRKHIVDQLLVDYRALLPNLTGDDRSRMDRHITSLVTLQTELAAIPDTSGSCALPTAVSGGDFAQTLKAQMDVAVLALKCDLTRVITLQCEKTNDGNVVHTHLGATYEHHALSHYGPKSSPDQTKLSQLKKVEDYYANQYAYLINELNKVPDAGGKTLLDNCAVVWCSNFSDGIQHNMSDVPFVIAGSCGGTIKTGQFLTYNANHTQMWTTMERAMGGTRAFGHDATGTAPETGILTKLLA